MFFINLKGVTKLKVADLIEGVEVPLPGLQTDDPALLQQVVADVSADGIPFVVEVYVHVFTEP